MVGAPPTTATVDITDRLVLVAGFDEHTKLDDTVRLIMSSGAVEVTVVSPSTLQVVYLVTSSTAATSAASTLKAVPGVLHVEASPRSEVPLPVPATTSRRPEATLSAAAPVAKTGGTTVSLVAVLLATILCATGVLVLSKTRRKHH